MPAAGKCPECGLEVGGDSGVDPYKHAIHCMHLTPGTVDRMIAEAEEQSEERGNRARTLLAFTNDEPQQPDTGGEQQPWPSI